MYRCAAKGELMEEREREIKRERGRGQTGREKGNDTKRVTQKALPKVNHGIEGFAGRIKKIMLSLKYPDTLTRQSPIQQTLFPILLNC